MLWGIRWRVVQCFYFYMDNSDMSRCLRLAIKLQGLLSYTLSRAAFTHLFGDVIRAKELTELEENGMCHSALTTCVLLLFGAKKTVLLHTKTSIYICIRFLFFLITWKLIKSPIPWCLSDISKDYKQDYKRSAMLQKMKCQLCDNYH